MDLKTLRKETEDLIAGGKTREALDFLLQNLRAGTDARAEVVQLSGAYNHFYNNHVLSGTLSFREADLEYNRINQALLEIVRRSIRDADIGSGSLDDDDPVERFVKKLDRSGRPALGLLDMVNCDRKDPAGFLWKTFDRQLEKGQKIQFYFLPACPSQRPDILAERFTYELLKDELKNQEARLRIHRREDNRLRVEELPIGARLRTACAAFKTYFAERFDLGAADTVFEDYLRTGLPTLPYDYVVRSRPVGSGGDGGLF